MSTHRELKYGLLACKSSLLVLSHNQFSIKTQEPKNLTKNTSIKHKHAVLSSLQMQKSCYNDFANKKGNFRSTKSHTTSEINVAMDLWQITLETSLSGKQLHWYCLPNYQQLTKINKHINNHWHKKTNSINTLMLLSQNMIVSSQHETITNQNLIILLTHKRRQFNILSTQPHHLSTHWCR